MDRADIEKLSINQLRTLAAQLKINTKGSRNEILDRIIDFYSKNGWPTQSEMDHLKDSGAQSEENVDPLLEVPPMERPVPLTFNMNPTSNNATGQASGESRAITGINVQEIVRAVVQEIEVRQRNSRGESPRDMRNGSAISSEGSTNNNWNQIKFATKLIPTFSGKTEENVVRWLERIAAVARMHHLGDDKIIWAAAIERSSIRVVQSTVIRIDSYMGGVQIPNKKILRGKGNIYCHISQNWTKNLEVKK